MARTSFTCRSPSVWFVLFSRLFFWFCFEFCCRYPLCRKLLLFCASAFVFTAVFPFSCCFRSDFAAAVFCLIFSSSSWYLSSNVDASLSPSFSSVWVRIFCILFLLCLSLFVSLCIDHECCHNTSVVDAHVDDVIGFSILTESRVPSFDQFVINLSFCSFKRSVYSLLSSRFSVHRVECCKVLHHQPLSHPVSSFVPFI